MKSNIVTPQQTLLLQNIKIFAKNNQTKMRKPWPDVYKHIVLMSFLLVCRQSAELGNHVRVCEGMC